METLRIIHFSDTHNHRESVTRLISLARRHDDWDVVAMTGDSASGVGPYAPPDLNDLPQPHLFSVPGNHDQEDTFVHLTRWVTKAPWARAVKDAWFIGLHHETKWRGPDALARSLASLPDREPTRMVFLMHYPPNNMRSTLDALFQQAPLKGLTAPLLILHGHNHPGDFTGTWEPEVRLSCGRTASVSHVYSAARRNRGAGHLITWRERVPECTSKRGD